MRRRLLPALWLAALTATAHPPLPPSVLNPRTPAEAWNVLRLAVANARQLLAEQRLEEVPDQISLCSPALRQLTPAAGSAVVVEAALAVQGTAQASLAGDAALATASLQRLEARLGKLAGSYDPRTVQAEIHFCPMHPEVLSEKAGAYCERCGMALVPRRIPASFIYQAAGVPSLRLAVESAAPVRAGVPAGVTLRLAHADGTPVRSEDLLVVHTQPIHLLIVDAGLGEYYHEHPAPMGELGAYRFVFTPRSAGPFRIFADLVPAATGVQEYPFVDLAGTVDGRPVPPREACLTSEAGGLHFRLSIDGLETAPLRAREARTLRIGITNGRGQPVTNLEPVMNAFAHMVGFYEDRQTVLHLHPVGGEVTEPARRGGPELEFRFFAPRSGALRLYCQVQVGGAMIFAPFDLPIP